MSLLAYSFASGIMLLALAAIYMLMMRNSTNFGFNRACLIMILTVSLVAPFISIPTLSDEAPAALAGNLTMTDIAADTTMNQPETNIIKIVGVIYLVGVVLIAARMMANFGFIIYLRHNSRRKEIGPLAVRIHSHKNIPPMSWGGEIYIADALLNADPTEVDMILNHEEAHRRQWHWVDLLLSNVVLAINWYNPAAWIMQHELIDVHEYEADRIASGKSVNQIQYQLLLIKKAAGSRFQAIADSLNHSSLKKRITMMTKNQLKRSTRLCSLALLPAVAVALLVSNSSCVKEAQKEVSTSDQVEQAAEAATEQSADSNAIEMDETLVVAFKTDDEKKEMPEIATPATYPGGMAALYQKLCEKINFVGDIDENGKVVVRFTIDAEGNVVNPHIVKGLSEAKNNETIRVVKELGKWEPAVGADGQKVACEFTLPVMFKSVEHQ